MICNDGNPLKETTPFSTSMPIQIYRFGTKSFLSPLSLLSLLMSTCKIISLPIGQLNFQSRLLRLYRATMQSDTREKQRICDTLLWREDQRRALKREIYVISLS